MLILYTYTSQQAFIEISNPSLFLQLSAKCKIPIFNRNAIGNINLHVFEILRVIPFSYNFMKITLMNSKLKWCKI